MPRAEELNKSIDDLLDEYFTAPGDVEKSDQIASQQSNKADDVVNKAPKGQDDDKRGAGRPKQISDVPKVDQDGKRAKDYDKDIKERDNKEEENPEKDQVKEKNQVKKSDEDPSDELAKSDREELEAFRLAKSEAAKEELKKAEEQKQEDLIKSVIEKTSKKYEDKIENLEKSLQEQSDLMKSFAKQPRQSKSITNIQALEKSHIPGNEGPESFTKSEMLDAAEELFEKGEIKDTEVIELENNGFILNPISRQKLEKKLQKN